MDIDYKVPDGKLLRISVELKNNFIKDIKINGDFFLHPEEKIVLLEKALKEVHIKNIKQILDPLIKREDMILIGFSSRDIEDAVKSGVF